MLPQWVCTDCANVGSSSAKPLATRAPVALIRLRRSSSPSLIIPVPSKSDNRAMARGALTMG
eukprot:10360539-Lingulodinium_polyedra.AAC.1